MPERQERSGTFRYGIGEWYGTVFTEIPPSERRRLAELQGVGLPSIACPFRSSPDTPVPCNKRGGICSLRGYERDAGDGTVKVAHGRRGGFCTLCPERFQEGGRIFRWIGETLLDTPSPAILNEIPFLERTAKGSDRGARHSLSREGVGKIGHVLVDANRDPLHWCAVEMQAVYFSGTGMGLEFDRLRAGTEEGIPFPTAVRRPDFRSSGPKRLMPQLEIKVPALRRWGKRMAVVVDRMFFDAIGDIAEVADLSSADIIWFVVDFAPAGSRAEIKLDSARFTTLESTVEGLTAARPVSLGVFESRIRAKLPR